MRRSARWTRRGCRGSDRMAASSPAMPRPRKCRCIPPSTRPGAPRARWCICIRRIRWRCRCCRRSIRAPLPPMTAYYLMKCGATALVPYYRPGDPAVADAIKGLAGKYASVLLANHGPVVAGESLEAAVFAIEELEETAKLYLLLRGLNPRYLSPAQVADLSKTFGLALPKHGHD